jgi:signal transduction histidine kinase
MLVAQIDALSSIASAFSDFARMPSTHIEPVEMVGLVREIATLFDAPEGYDLHVSYPEQSAVFVSGDRDQLRRALVNIVRNATQAIQTRSRGTILVSVEVTGQMLRIAVSDNGSGIPEADRDRLFEPSFTTKSGGMGLGLAITKSIIENYRGEIGFQSDEGGTTFYLDFPLS